MNRLKLFLLLFLTVAGAFQISACNDGGARIVDGSDTFPFAGDWDVVANGFKLRLFIDKGDESNISGGFVAEPSKDKLALETRIAGAVDLKNNTIKFVRLDSSNKPFQEYVGKLSFTNTSGSKQMVGVFTHQEKGSYPWKAERVGD